MRNTDKLLFDIADAAHLVAGFVKGMERNEFFADLKTQSAVLYRLAIIGEAVKQLPDEWRDQHPAIPWSQIGRMRDHLLHRYFNVDLEMVWQTATNDVPDLLIYILPFVSPLLLSSTSQGQADSKV